jgi:hypothetical protein
MLAEINKEISELRQDVADCRTDITRNSENIHNVNTRQGKLCCLLNLIKITCLFEVFFLGGRVY